MKTIYLLLFVFALMSSCKRISVNNSIPGRYYTSSTDAFVVIELDNNGDARRYNKHMGGDFEWTGKWSDKKDSIQIVFSTLNTIFENEKLINDTTMLAISKQDGSLSFFKKIDYDEDKKEMTDKFIEKIKLSVRAYDKNENDD